MRSICFNFLKAVDVVSNIQFLFQQLLHFNGIFGENLIAVKLIFAKFYSIF
jgi:hypothetical protein